MTKQTAPAAGTTPGSPTEGTGELALPPLGHYVIDPTHSTLTFRARHLFGLGGVRGGFAVSGGSVDITEPAGACRVAAEVDAASFHSGNRTRDEHVRDEKFLAAARYPTMTFTATGLARADADAVLRGRLTVRGITRPVELLIDGASVRRAPTWFEVRASTVIDRTEFGVTASRGLAGRRLRLSLTVRCVRG
jgi:polyisoprenoid-binding protein YceI